MTFRSSAMLHPSPGALLFALNFKSNPQRGQLRKRGRGPCNVFGWRWMHLQFRCCCSLPAVDCSAYIPLMRQGEKKGNVGIITVRGTGLCMGWTSCYQPANANLLQMYQMCCRSYQSFLNTHTRAVHSLTRFELCLWCVFPTLAHVKWKLRCTAAIFNSLIYKPCYHGEMRKTNKLNLGR